MDSFIHVAGWSQHRSQQPSPRPSSARSFGHLRSLSSIATTTTSSSSPPSPAPTYKGRLPPKSPSTSQIPAISLTSSPLPIPYFNDEMSTLPDPRRRALSAASQPDRAGLDGEVATLSTKLVNAINHQTVLDDTLTATRQELQAARDRIQELEALNQQQRDMLSGDVWVRRSTLESDRKAMQAEKKSLQAKLMEETTKRLDTETEKRKMEQELENLTTALFEEANQMVIAAKEEAQTQHEGLQRKIDQLKSQLADSESLLKSQQEQLSQLKEVMETMSAERDDQTSGTTPSSPGICRLEASEDEASGLHGACLSHENMAPCNPTSLQHLIQPILRTDLATFDDFTVLARSSHQRRGSRVSSGSLGSLTALALGLGGSTSSAHPSNASTSSLSASVPATSSAPQSPNTPASTVSAASAAVSAASAPNLSTTKFYKRVLAEDIEPTLRLDIAPGLSWLARRSVLTSMTDGSLVVEPVSTSATSAASAKLQTHPCSLCGEARSDPEYLRRHRFKTSEADSAQRYPLCSYCLNRVRSTCDFLGFLRMVKDGHWRADDENHERAAWEESVRLREQMFWARIGGGVVPATQLQAQSTGPTSTVTDKDGRPSHDEPSSSSNGNDGAAPSDAAPLAVGDASKPHTSPDQTGPGHRPVSAQSASTME